MHLHVGIKAILPCLHQPFTLVGLLTSGTEIRRNISDEVFVHSNRDACLPCEKSRLNSDGNTSTLYLQYLKINSL
jgi:hypothetical protein